LTDAGQLHDKHTYFYLHHSLRDYILSAEWTSYLWQTFFANGWGATSENRHLARSGSVSAKFHIEGDVPHQLFIHGQIVNECLTTLLLTVFTQRNFVADFLQAKCDFTWKTAILRFEAPFRGHRGNVRCSS